MPSGSIVHTINMNEVRKETINIKIRSSNNSMTEHEVKSSAKIKELIKDKLSNF